MPTVSFITFVPNKYLRQQSASPGSNIESTKAAVFAPAEKLPSGVLQQHMKKSDNTFYYYNFLAQSKILALFSKPKYMCCMKALKFSMGA